jgi:tetratricopeptide (TPR) repeat protein
MGIGFHPSKASNGTKLVRWLAVILLVLFLDITHSAPSAGQAQRGDFAFLPLSSLKLQDIDSETDMAKSFAVWRKAIEKGDETEAFPEVSKSVSLMGKMGTRNLFSISEICLLQARKALSAGSSGQAVTAARYALLFAPDNPDAYFLLARAQFEADKGNVVAVSMDVVNGLNALASDRFRRDAFLADAALYVAMALLVTFGVAFISFFVRNYASVFMNITDFMPSVQQGWWKFAAGIIVMLIPLAFGGWLFLILAAPLFLWPTLNREGKAVAVMFAAVVFCAPQLFGYMAKSAALAEADTYRALYLLSKNTWDYETKAALEKEREAQPDNKLIASALGLLNKMRKDKDAAVKAYKAVLDSDKNNLRALVNMGNAYYVAKEYENAVFMYKKAIEVDPQSVEAHFNLSVTYTEMVRTEDSTAEYKRASAIDPKRANELVAATKDQDHDRRVVDFPVTSEDLASYERELGEKTWAMAEHMWIANFIPLSIGVYMYVAAAFAVLLLLSEAFWSKREAHQSCSTCGAAFQPPVRLGADQVQCNQCVAAQITKPGVSAAKKDKKRKDMREFKERRRLASVIMDGLFPGAGRLLANECATGLFFAFVTSLLAVYVVTSLVGALLAQSAPLEAALKPHVTFFAIAGGYWVVMNTLLRRDFY